MFNCEAPEMFCGVFNRTWLSISVRVSRCWLKYLFWVNLSFRTQYMVQYYWCGMLRPFLCVTSPLLAGVFEFVGLFASLPLIDSLPLVHSLPLPLSSHTSQDISSWRWPPLTLQSCLSQFTPSHKVQPAWQAGLMMFSLQRPQASTALMVSECFQPCLVVDRQPRHSSCWPTQRLNYTSISISKPADLTTQTELFSSPASC